IAVDSEKGVGTTFTVAVPLRDCERWERQLDAVRAQDLRVLIAEDMDINAEILADLLELLDVESERAENGQVAVEMFDRSAPGHYDAILMDVRMPVMDGLEATRSLRKLPRADARSIPVIAMTANAFDEDVQRSLQAGMNAPLSKPVDIDRLKETLQELIQD
ncbi:MAG: response regulator, partial [Clostridia bacterium]|nr:response regulator [Clostridia bacterium]